MVIYFSGLESPEAENYFPLLDEGMMSFYYLSQDGPCDHLAMAAEEYDMRLIVDSGAHTFHADQGLDGEAVGNYSNLKDRKRSTDAVDPDRYFRRYLDWVKANWQWIYRFVELDIGNVVGQRKVNEWYDVIREEGLARKCIRVWHANYCTRDDWRSWVDDCPSGWIGTEGPDRMDDNPVPFVRYAYDRGVRVHAFGVTGPALKRIPYYSSDSTTYRMGFKYGKYLSFDPAEAAIKQREWKNPADYDGEVEMRRVFRTRYAEREKGTVESEDRKIERVARGEQGIREFEKFQRFLTRLWRRRGVRWEEQVERERAG